MWLFRILIESSLFCPCGAVTQMPKSTNGKITNENDEVELMKNLIDDLIWMLFLLAIPNIKQIININSMVKAEKTEMAQIFCWIPYVIFRQESVLNYVGLKSCPSWLPLNRLYPSQRFAYYIMVGVIV